MDRTREPPPTRAETEMNRKRDSSFFPMGRGTHLQQKSAEASVSFRRSICTPKKVYREWASLGEISGEVESMSENALLTRVRKLRGWKQLQSFPMKRVEPEASTGRSCKPPGGDFPCPKKAGRDTSGGSFKDWHLKDGGWFLCGHD